MKTHWVNIAILAIVTAILADQLSKGRKLEQILNRLQG